MSKTVVPTRRAQSPGKWARPLGSPVTKRALSGNVASVGTRRSWRWPAARGAVGPRQLGGPARALRRSRRATTRRRNVLEALFGALAACVALAAATGATDAWWAALGLVVVASAYLVLLGRARRIEAEREFHLAFLPARMGALGFDEMFSAAGHSEVGSAAGGARAGG